MVVEVKPFGLHGVTYYDVTVEFADRTIEQARLGPEGVPDGLQPGERVLATRAANMVISLRRPSLSCCPWRADSAPAVGQGFEKSWGRHGGSKTLSVSALAGWKVWPTWSGSS